MHTYIHAYIHAYMHPYIHIILSNIFEVKSLYTCILHNFGLEAIRFWIKEHLDSLHSRFAKEFVLESIKMILENNCVFNDEFYRQISGTTMGTIFVPAYATLTMRYFEVRFYTICELKWGRKFH